MVSVYKDKLNGHKKTKKTFRYKFRNAFKNKFLLNLKKRIFGTFEEKEQAKEFFRNLKRLFFAYDAYEANYNSIDKWLPKK